MKKPNKNTGFIGIMGVKWSIDGVKPHVTPITTLNTTE